MPAELVLVVVPSSVLLMGLLARRGWETAAQRPTAHLRPVGQWEAPWFARRRRSRGPSSAVDLHRLRSELTGGASLHGALESVASGGGPWAIPAGRVVARAAAGHRLDRALDAWATEYPDPTVGLLVDSLVIVSRTGASYHRAIAAVADLVHDQEALRHEIRSVTAQARASALVLVATPLGFAVLLAVVDSRIRTFFVGSWLGLGCVLAGLALDMVGGWWMHRIVRSVQ